MSEIKYTKKLTKKLEFEFWFEDEEKACGYFGEKLDSLCRIISQQCPFKSISEAMNITAVVYFERDDIYSEDITFTSCDDTERIGVIKLKVTESWG